MDWLTKLLSSGQGINVPPVNMQDPAMAAPSLVDQIPGMLPQPRQPMQREDPVLEKLKRIFLSGGGGDLRNLAMALGPAGQAAGGMGQAAMMGQRAGMPARAPGGMDMAEQMFGRGPAPVMRPPMGGPGMPQGGGIDPRLALGAGLTGGAGAALGPDIMRVIEMLRARAGQGQ